MSHASAIDASSLDRRELVLLVNNGGGVSSKDHAFAQWQLLDMTARMKAAVHNEAAKASAAAAAEASAYGKLHGFIGPQFDRLFRRSNHTATLARLAWNSSSRATIKAQRARAAYDRILKDIYK